MVSGKRKEKISAFLDNDMHRDELMSFSLSAEPDDAQIAQRYQMVGDTLRGEMSESSFIDVSAAVRDAVAATTMDASTVDSPAVSISTEPASKASIFDVSAWFKPVAGMAMAVTVAVVMVLVVSEQDSAGIAPVATNTAVPPAVIQLASDPAAVDSATINPIVADAQTPVNQRLVNQHLEFATQDTLQGRMPYVRAVGFEPGAAVNTDANTPGVEQQISKPVPLNQ